MFEIINNLRYKLSNLPGWRTDRKIIVFESDDWGSVRMSSEKSFKSLVKAGLQIENDPYCRFDALESNSDLESLFEVISRFRDKNGNHPVFTGLNVVANPDFEKIKASGFQHYFYEPFTETLKKYPQHDKVYDLWKEGINKKLLVPQFHGREHLNVQIWLRDLQAGNRHTKLAFEHNLWGVYSPLIKHEYQAAFDLQHPGDIHYMHSVIEEGVDMFATLFGYQPIYFVPTNGPFNLNLENILHRKGIKYILLDKMQKEPLGNGKFKTHFRYLGKRNSIGQIYMSRNAVFEPAQFPGIDSVNQCLRSINAMFRLKKPVTISTHRVNYIGWLNHANRDQNLNQLNLLLNQILKRWPDVEFMTSTELGNLIGESRK